VPDLAVEDVLDGIKTYLSSNLESTLTTIESARSCTVTRWKALERKIILSRQFPCIEVLPGPGDYDYGEAGDMYHTGPMDMDIVVRIRHALLDAGAMLEDLMRYQEALQTLARGSMDWGMGVRVAVQIAEFDFDEFIENAKERQIGLMFIQAFNVVAQPGSS